MKNVEFGVLGMLLNGRREELRVEGRVDKSFWVVVFVVYALKIRLVSHAGTRPISEAEMNKPFQLDTFFAGKS